MNNQPNNYDLAIGFLQVFNLLLNLNQISNDDILKELKTQDSLYLEKILGKVEAFDSQGYGYFTEIIRQNKQILENQEKILKRLGDK